MTTHSEKRVLAHKPEQLFDLVADVQRYRVSALVCGCPYPSKNEDMLIADLIIGFQMFRKALPPMSKWIERRC